MTEKGLRARRSAEGGTGGAIAQYEHRVPAGCVKCCAVTVRMEGDVRELEGRVAVVTGGASGIGRAIAERSAAEGMRVVLADVEEPALDLAVHELREQGSDVIGVVTDVSDAAAVERLRDEALEAFGAIHLVCNNAGVTANSDRGPGEAGLGLQLWEQSRDAFSWLFDVNLWGVVHGIRTFVPVLIEQEEGHLVNTGSDLGLVTREYYGIYAATKHAVVALTETLARQLAGSSVGVSVLCPGPVETRIRLAKRTRPGREGEALRSPTAARDAAGGTVAAGEFKEGMDPADVAAQVVEAVRDERFYILTHPDRADHAIRARMEGILARRHPVTAAGWWPRPPT